MKIRLDRALVKKGLVATRSQAENYIKLGYVLVGGEPVTKSGELVETAREIKLIIKEQYVSRAALKLESVAAKFKLDFKRKTVLDVGSSTGGFTDYSLRHGAKEVIAVDVGTNQLHPDLRKNPKIELHEKTDIRSFKTKKKINTVLVDVSFISLREVLPSIAEMVSPSTQIVALLKPQFEAGKTEIKKGVVKNEHYRRQILKRFELWTRKYFVITNKADSSIAGAEGNRERFYLLTKRSK